MKETNPDKPLPARFYQRETLTVARELLGKIIVRKTDNQVMTALIVETEAYIGDHDPASHSYNKITERNKVMYSDGGKVYVYFIYGNYYCFNIVTGKKGEGNAVLIRAAQPLTGIEQMKKFRGSINSIHDLTNGPSKLCMALGIDGSLYGEEVTKQGRVYVTRNRISGKIRVAISKRIGINAATDFPYRFFIKDNPYVTKHKLNKEIISESEIII